jgi:hypothetical protein
MDNEQTFVLGPALNPSDLEGNRQLLILVTPKLLPKQQPR